MANTLYLECNAGISGDMTVAALLDLGADRERLAQALAGIPAEGFSTEIGRVKKAGIDCCDFRVLLDQVHENHDHDMAYLHGHVHEKVQETGHGHVHGEAQEAGHEHVHGEAQEAGHEHAHDGAHGHSHGHAHHHTHRGMTEIRSILQACPMTERARATAVRIFEILATAEAKAHDVPVEEVHFHEVGAMDSIVDIVAAAVCLDSLDITEVIIPKLCEGTGTIRCQHGILPVPVPATANILAAYGIRLELTGIQGEFVTPTGAAIAAAVRTGERLPDTFYIRKIGLGAGKRQYERPSILRAMLIEAGEEDKGGAGEDIWKLETNLDDCPGEALGYVMERLLEEGARDVHYIPAYMKKNRPAWQLNVICERKDIPALEEIIFVETTTIGVRRIPVERSTLARSEMLLDTIYGKMSVKVCQIQGGRRYYPEYESVAAVCRSRGLPYLQVFRELTRLAEKAEDDRI